jgi:hypothetical protein
VARSVARPGQPCPRCGEIHTKCLGHNRARKPCGNSPAPGGTVCRLHGGKSPNARAAAHRRLEEAAAARAVEAFGLPRDIDPAAALLEEVGRSAGAVEWLRARVVEVGADPNDLVHGTRLVRRKTTDDGSETTTEIGPGVHLWVQLYQQERRHLADVCAKALAAGAQERQVQLAERQGELAAQILTAVLDDLHLTAAEHQRALEVAGRHFTLLRGTG